MDRHLKAILKGPQIPMAGRKGITGEIVGRLRLIDEKAITVLIDPIVDDYAETPHIALLFEAPVMYCKLEGMKTSETLLELSNAFGRLAIEMRKKSFELLEEGR